MLSTRLATISFLLIVILSIPVAASAHYSPHLGRFLQPDPAGYVDGTELYAYVGDRPTLHRDPSGLQQEEIADPDVVNDRNGVVDPKFIAAMERYSQYAAKGYHSTGTPRYDEFADWYFNRTTWRSVYLPKVNEPTAKDVYDIVTTEKQMLALLQSFGDYDAATRYLISLAQQGLELAEDERQDLFPELKFANEYLKLYARMAELISHFEVRGWRIEAEDTGQVICERSKRAVGRSLAGIGVLHVDLFYRDTVILEGWGGVPETGSPEDQGKPLKTWKLRRKIFPESTLKWGWGAGASSMVATEEQIIVCVESAPEVTGAFNEISNTCQQHIQSVIEGCGLGGFMALGLPPNPANYK